MEKVLMVDNWCGAVLLCKVSLLEKRSALWRLMYSVSALLWSIEGWEEGEDTFSNFFFPSFRDNQTMLKWPGRPVDHVTNKKITKEKFRSFRRNKISRGRLK